VGRTRIRSTRALTGLALTAGALAVSTGSAWANPPQPPHAFANLYQAGTLPTVVPTTGDVELPLKILMTGQPIPDGALVVTAPAGTEFDAAHNANPMWCSVPSPTVYSCTLPGGYFSSWQTLDVPLRATDPTADPTGGSATLTPHWTGLSPITIPLQVVFAKCQVQAVPMLSPAVAGAAATAAVPGAVLLRRRRRTRSRAHHA
jgi:hypothetical protein